jgi:hypothetical protein
MGFVGTTIPIPPELLDVNEVEQVSCVNDSTSEDELYVDSI